MPAKSKAQQRLFGMVDAYKKGDLKHASKKIKDIADEMDSGEVKKFAKTKTHNLPETVDENIVRINESQLRQIVKGCVHDILKENHKYTQLRNVLGIHDNDEWNAAAETERREDLESEIWKSLADLAGGNPRKTPFNFQDAIDILKNEFGFKYVGYDEERESHKFINKEQDELEIFPVSFYTQQGHMRIKNMNIY